MALLTDTELAISQRFNLAFDSLKAQNKFSNEGEFCSSLGLVQANFSKYKRNERLVPIDALIKLINTYGVSERWLLLNEGDIYSKEQEENTFLPDSLKAQQGIPVNIIPLYDIDLNAGNVERLIEGNNNVPMIGYMHFEDEAATKGLMGVRAIGNSMATYINGGDMLLVRKITNMNAIPLGEPYVLVTDELSMVKYIRAGSSPDTWTLRSHNKDIYEDFEILKSEVQHLFAVVKVLKEITY